MGVLARPGLLTMTTTLPLDVNAAEPARSTSSQDMLGHARRALLEGGLHQSGTSHRTESHRN